MSKDRPYKHRKAQKEAKSLEQNQCIVCGKVDPNAEGHHLIFYSEGGSADMQNMVTMCRSCHRLYHAGKLDIDIERF